MIYADVMFLCNVYAFRSVITLSVLTMTVPINADL